MKTRFLYKASSLLLALFMVFGAVSGTVIYAAAEDAENGNGSLDVSNIATPAVTAGLDVSNIATPAVTVDLDVSNIATPAITAIKENPLQPVDDSLDLNALEVNDSISFSLSVDDFVWKDDEAPTELSKDILDANNITVGYTLDEGPEFFKAIDFYEPDSVDHIRLDFNAPVDGESGEFEYNLYLMRDGVIAEGTGICIKGKIVPTMQGNPSTLPEDANCAEDRVIVKLLNNPRARFATPDLGVGYSESD